MEFTTKEMLLEKQTYNNLYFITEVPPTTFDPIDCFDIVTKNVLGNVYESLVGQDPKTLEVIPSLADSWEELLPDMIYNFKLRSNIYFSNGDPILNEDIVYSLKRAISIHGVGIEIVDMGNRQLKIVLEQPIHNFLDYLATVQFSIVPFKQQYKVGSDIGRIVGSGPYRFKCLEFFDGQKGVVLEKNPYYRDFKSIYIDQVTFIPIKDANKRLEFFKNRSQQIEQNNYYFLNHGPVALYHDLKNDREFSPTPVMGTIVLTLNNTKFPLNNMKVRKAIGYAIDRVKIINEVIPHLTPAHSLIPKIMRPTLSEGDLFKEDVSLARELLAEAGFPNGKDFPELKITILDHHFQALKAQIIIGTLKNELNIKLTYESVSWAEYLKKMDNGDYDILYETWLTEVNEMGSFLHPFRSLEPLNTAKFSNNKYDALLLKALSTYEKRFRDDMYLEAEKLLIGEMPIIPLFFDAHFSFFDKALSEIYLNKAGFLDIKNIKA